MIRRAIVTGAAGHLGGELVRLLRARGAGVLPIVRVFDERAPEGSIAMDLTNPKWQAVEEFATEDTTVIHAAAEVPWRGREFDTEAKAQRTRQIDSAVADFAHRTGFRAIYISGCGLYDPQTDAYKNESSPVRGRTPYLRAKACGERLFLEAGLGCAVRLSNPVGRYMPRTTVLGLWVRQAVVGGTLEVWGKGCREQDYLAVEDVLSGIDAVRSNGQEGVFNLSYGRPVSMLQLAETVVSVVGRGVVRLTGEHDDSDCETARYSNEKAQSLGWRPQVELPTAIRRSLSYMETRR